MYVRSNQSPFTIRLSKAIIQKSKLRNIFLKNRTEENRNNYAKQRNLCVTLLRKSKRQFYGNLNEKKLCDNTKFWGIILSLYYLIKLLLMKKITLVEKDNIGENDKKIATVLKKFFSNIISNLGIPRYIEGEPASQNIDDPLMKAITKYRLHRSIIAIK